MVFNLSNTFLLGVILIFVIINSSDKQNANAISLNERKWYAYCHFKGDAYDILSCSKCILNDTINRLNNNNSNNNNNNNNEITNHCPYYDRNLQLNEFNTYIDDVSLVPYLTHQWFHFDILYMIERNELMTNLDNLTLNHLTKLSDRLKIIELNNFGVEIIGKGAFKRFQKLKVLRLSNNNINNLEFSSFSTTDTSIDTDNKDEAKDLSEYSSNTTLNSTSSNNNNNNNKQSTSSQSQLIELDLSNNRLINIKVENFFYLENLKILNLSHNYIKNVDLRFISLIAPRLQVLDLSYNLLKKFDFTPKLSYILPQESYNYNVTDLISYYQSNILIANILFKDLIYVNLQANYLTEPIDLFKFNANYIVMENEFCRLSQFETYSYIKRQSPVHVNIKNNTWNCDCDSFEFISSIIDYQKSASAIDFSKRNVSLLRSSLTMSLEGMLSEQLFSNRYSNSCLLNMMFKQNNLFSINQIQNIESINSLTCVLYENSTNESIENWYMWYIKQCGKATSTTEVDDSTTDETNYRMSTSNIPTIFSQITRNQVTQQTRPLVSTSTPSSSSNSAWFSSTQKYNILTTTKNHKYDISAAFYWISSICIAIVTISCLFVAWFYCWKRYRLSHRIMMDSFTNSSMNNLSSAICRSSTARCMQRRNIYLLNSRFTSDNQRAFHNNLLLTSQNDYRNSSNNTSTSTTTNNTSNNTRNGNITGLYYISLNRDANTDNISTSNNNNSNSSSNSNNTTSENNSVRQSNHHYNIRDDEPPNYYEAISIKNTRTSNKNYNSTRETRIRTTSTTTNSAVNQNVNNNNNNNTTPVVSIQNNDGANGDYDNNGQSTDV